MSLSAKLRRAPMRIATGAFILNSGIGKLSVGDDAATMMHGMATGTYPFLGKLDPKLFTKALAAGELALGGALLLPIVPPVVAGAALTGFSSALLNMYWQTEGMHGEGDPRPTQDGIAIAKDVWLFGIGVGLVADAVFEPAHNKKLELGVSAAAKGRQARKSAKRLKKSNKSSAQQAKAIAKQTRAELGRRGQKAATKAQEQAAKAQATAGKAKGKAGKAKTGKSSGDTGSGATAAAAAAGALAMKAQQARGAAKGYVDQYGPVAADKAKLARDAVVAAGTAKAAG